MISLLFPEQNLVNLEPIESGMSKIRDRAKAAPAKSQNFQDNGLPVSGKKFRSVSLKPPISSA
jgi:hypothetical protein